MKIHITLVGAQPAPVYNGIVAAQPDIVEFVYSDDTVKVVERIKNEINCKVNDSKPLSPTDINEIKKRAEELYNTYQDDEVVLNISGGTKPWSHFFAIAFANHPNCRVVYIDQKNVLWDLTNMSNEQLTLDIDIERVFRLYGSALYSHTDFKEYTQEDDNAYNKIKSLRNFNTKEFNGLFIIQDNQTKNYLQRKEGGYNSPSKNSSVDWTVNSKGRKCYEIKIGSNKGVRYENLCSPHATELLFNTGWFEYEVAKLFSRWNKSKEIWLNCVVRSNNNKDLNEIDVIVNTGTKILFVECKTQIHTISDIDKFRSVVKNYGGMGSMGIFITDEAKSLEAKEKCIKNDIIEISLKDYSNSNGKIDELSIFRLIDSVLSRINTR